jgi:hypothetical protein
MFSLLDLNLPVAVGNLGSEINIATVEQGNTAIGSAAVLQGNSSVIGQTTGDGIDFF